MAIEILDGPIKRGRPRRVKSNKPGIVIMSVVAVLLLLTAIFPNFFLSNFFTGLFGVYVYAIYIATFAAGFAIYKRKKYSVNKRYVILSALMLGSMFTAIHIGVTSIALDEMSFGAYLGNSFSEITPGGVTFGFFAYIFHVVFLLELSLVLMGIIFIVSAAFLTTHIVGAVGENKVIKKLDSEPEFFEVTTKKERQNDIGKHLDEEYQQLLVNEGRRKHNKNKSALGLDVAIQKGERPPAEEPIPHTELPADTSVPDSINEYSSRAAHLLNDGLKSAPSLSVETRLKPPIYTSIGTGNVSANFVPNTPPPQPSIPNFAPQGNFGGAPGGFGSANMNANAISAPSSPFVAPPPMPIAPPPSFGNYANSGSQGFSSPLYSPPANVSLPLQQKPDFSDESEQESVAPTFGQLSRDIPMRDTIVSVPPPVVIPASNTYSSDRDFSGLGGNEKQKEEVKKPKPYKRSKYIRPSIDLINTESTPLDEARSEAIMKQHLLDAKLKEFGVNAKVTNFTVAPAVTRFEIQLATGTRVQQVLNLETDLGYVLGSTNLRIESTIEGKNAIGLEVPNKSVGKVSIKDLINTKEFANHGSQLAVILGKNINDEVVIGDIATMPHLLIAGSTGAGKSVSLNTILTSLVFRAHPDDVKLLLVDMKRVELTMYNELPHMLVPKAIKEVSHAINALKWMQTEMTRRYDLLESHGVNNIKLYQDLPEYKAGNLERMPYILMVIDEAADLLARGKKDIEDAIKSLSALARACGIHIILATQRPSVDVITPVIKTNLPTRIAFKVTSRGDSQTILSETGAEKLVGRGDMLYSRDGRNQRVQGAYIEAEETRRIMQFVRENNVSDFDVELEDIILNGPPPENVNGFVDADLQRGKVQDPYFIPILKWIVREDNLTRTVSISNMQRQFSLGFSRAGKIMDALTNAGYVGMGNGSKARDVLATREDIIAMYGE